MKTAISVPDEIFEDAEALAARLGKSRSQLYAEAMAEYLTRHDPESVTERMDRALDAIAGSEDPFVTETTRSILEKIEW
jgi:metal-responsive CopG/Arc/MetJ family transcriptional regulator